MQDTKAAMETYGQSLYYTRTAGLLFRHKEAHYDQGLMPLVLHFCDAVTHTSTPQEMAQQQAEDRRQTWQTRRRAEGEEGEEGEEEAQSAVGVNLALLPERATFDDILASLTPHPSPS